MVYVMPSSSARCSQLPRAVDKVPFYAALKKLRDYARGNLPDLDESEVCFPDLELKVVKREVKAEIKEEVESATNMGGAQNYPSVVQSSNDNALVPVKQEPNHADNEYGNGNMNNMYSSQQNNRMTDGSMFYKSQAACTSTAPDDPGQVVHQRMMQMMGTYPSQGFQASMFAAQSSQNNQHSMFMSSRMSFVTPPVSGINHQGQIPYFNSQVPATNQGQSSSSMFIPQSLDQHSQVPTSQGQSSSMFNPQSLNQHENPPDFPPIVSSSSSSSSSNWTNSRYTQGQGTGYDQMNNPVLIKPEPDDSTFVSTSQPGQSQIKREPGVFDSQGPCPYANMG